MIENGTTGLKTWRASLVLAQFLINHPGKLIVLTDWTVVNQASWRRYLELVKGRGVTSLIDGSLADEAEGVRDTNDFRVKRDLASDVGVGVAKDFTLRRLAPSFGKIGFAYS